MQQQTQCPQCHTIYKVTTIQLTVAQGMVCCAKCLATFNALTQLVDLAPSQINAQKATTPIAPLSPFNIFQAKVEHSDIDLECYLNHLSYLDRNALHTMTRLHLSQNTKPSNRKKTQRQIKLFLIALIGLMLWLSFTVD